MDLYLYSTKDSPEVVNKNLEEIEHYTAVHLLEDTSVLTPTIEVYDSTIIDHIWKVNYMYIPKFHRYYYVTDAIATAGLYRFTGKVDVLKTYRDSILFNSQIVSRQEKKQDRYLHDNMIPISDKQEVQEVEFGDTFDDSNSLFILVTTGQQGYEEGEG